MKNLPKLLFFPYSVILQSIAISSAVPVMIIIAIKAINTLENIINKYLIKEFFNNNYYCIRQNYIFPRLEKVVFVFFCAESFSNLGKSMSKTNLLEKLAQKFSQILKSLENIKNVNKINFICPLFAIFAQNKVCFPFFKTLISPKVGHRGMHQNLHYQD